MKKLFPLILLPFLTACYQNQYKTTVVGSTQDKLTLYTEIGTFKVSQPQYFLEGKLCEFTAIGDHILTDSMDCE